jgi:hypothetical protein
MYAPQHRPGLKIDLLTHQQIFSDRHLAEELLTYRNMEAQEDVFGRQRSDVGAVEPKHPTRGNDARERATVLPTHVAADKDNDFASMCLEVELEQLRYSSGPYLSPAMRNNGSLMRAS